MNVYKHNFFIIVYALSITSFSLNGMQKKKPNLSIDTSEQSIKSDFDVKKLIDKIERKSSPSRKKNELQQLLDAIKIAPNLENALMIIEKKITDRDAYIKNCENRKKTNTLLYAIVSNYKEIWSVSNKNKVSSSPMTIIKSPNPSPILKFSPHGGIWQEPSTPKEFTRDRGYSLPEHFLSILNPEIPDAILADYEKMK